MNSKGQTDDATSHDLRISSPGSGITIGQLKRMMAKLNIPDDATIKLPNGDVWSLLGGMSYCRSEREVFLW